MYCNNNNHKMIAMLVLVSLMLLLLDSVDSMNGSGSSSKKRGKQKSIKLGQKYEPTTEKGQSYLDDCIDICKPIEKNACNSGLNIQIANSSFYCGCEWKPGHLGFGGSCVPSNAFRNNLAEMENPELHS